MSDRRSETPSGPLSPGLFRSYKVVLRARQGASNEDKTVEVRARTQGGARRAALREFPGFVIVHIERLG